MGVSIETVGLQLHLLASAFRRKISSDQITTYHAVLDRHVREESEFIRACEFVLENEAQFPPVSLLLRLSRESSRNRSEVGVPWIRDHAKEPVAPLREWLDAIEAHRSVGWVGMFSGTIERATWEAAVSGCGGGPSSEEGAVSFLKRVSDVMWEDARITGGGGSADGRSDAPPAATGVSDGSSALGPWKALP